jgi:hypothetical protein
MQHNEDFKMNFTIIQIQVLNGIRELWLYVNSYTFTIVNENIWLFKLWGKYIEEVYVINVSYLEHVSKIWIWISSIFNFEDRKKCKWKTFCKLLHLQSKIILISKIKIACYKREKCKFNIEITPKQSCLHPT